MPPPYLRSVLAGGGRSVMSSRNFSSSLPKKLEFPLEDFTNVELMKGGFILWIGWEARDFLKRYTEHVYRIPARAEEARKGPEDVKKVEAAQGKE